MSGAPTVRDRVRATAIRWLPYWLLSAGLFLTLAIIGGAVGAKRAAPFIPVRSTGDPVIVLGAMDLLVHNGSIALRMVAGVFLLGLPTLYIAAFNGFVIGATFADAAASLGALETILIIAPHGVIELPAFWLAGAIGFRWVHLVWQVASGSRDRTPAGVLLVESLFLSLVVFLGLAVAALIEATITLELARLVT